jgi:tetratricopeptide (TPR) repeat protein
MILQRDNAVSTIRAWLEGTRSFGLPAGPSRVEALRRAEDLIARLKTQPLAQLVRELDRDPETPDILCAMSGHFDRDFGEPSSATLLDVERVYDLVSALTWDDEFGERDWLLARLAFHAWNRSRQLEDYPGLRSWQRRCHDHTVSQEPVRDFLALPFQRRSEELNCRFLGDESVLLAAVEKLERLRNKACVELTVEGAALYEWITDEAIQSQFDNEFVEYLAASVAVLVLISENALEHHDRSQEWFRRCDRHVDRCRGSAPLRAVLEHVRASRLYWDGAYSTALARMDGVIARFESLQMRESAVRSIYLRALLLKESGKIDVALTQFDHVLSLAREIDDKTMASLALSNCAQIRGAQDRFTEASQIALKAFEVAKAAGTPMALAMAAGTAGELLRDQGDLEAAVRAYAGCARYYAAAGMESLVAYTRLLIADTLLMAGRAREATGEILAALPAIENHCLGQEAVAASSLLRKAVQIQQSEPETLCQVREQLRLLRECSKL